jgi:hypothetical protein
MEPRLLDLVHPTSDFSFEGLWSGTENRYRQQFVAPIPLSRYDVDNGLMEPKAYSPLYQSGHDQDRSVAKVIQRARRYRRKLDADYRREAAKPKPGIIAREMAVYKEWTDTLKSLDKSWIDSLKDKTTAELLALVLGR